MSKLGFLGGRSEVTVTKKWEINTAVNIIFIGLGEAFHWHLSPGVLDGLRIELGPLGGQGSTLVDRILDELSQEHSPGDVWVSTIMLLIQTHLESPFLLLLFPLSALPSTFFPNPSL